MKHNDIIFDNKFMRDIVEDDYWECFNENNSDVDLLLKEQEFDDEVMYMSRFTRFPIPINGITMKNVDCNWEYLQEDGVC